jgi:hypothetical protein
MDCIRIDRLRQDMMICAAADDGIVNGNENYDQIMTGKTPSTENCIAPRDVVISGSIAPACKVCSTGGMLNTCPMTDPSFLSCLCAHHVSPKHLDCLSRCFMPGLASDLKCGLQKRDGPQYHPPAEKMKRSQNTLQTLGLNFYIDSFGRPVYENGVIGFPLPYWEKVIANGLGLKRCYLFPLTTDMWCVRWRLPEAVEEDYASGRFANADYGTEYEEDEEDETVTPSHTEAPESTEIPTATALPTLEDTSAAAETPTTSDKVDEPGLANSQRPALLLASCLVVVGLII